MKNWIIIVLMILAAIVTGLLLNVLLNAMGLNTKGTNVPVVIVVGILVPLVINFMKKKGMM